MKEEEEEEEAVVNDVEYGGDVKETKAGDLLVADGNLLCAVAGRASKDWCLVKLDCWGLRSEVTRVRIILSVNLGRMEKLEMGR